jgi:hypothetical protein
MILGQISVQCPIECLTVCGGHNSNIYGLYRQKSSNSRSNQKLNMCGGQKLPSAPLLSTNVTPPHCKQKIKSELLPFVPLLSRAPGYLPVTHTTHTYNVCSDTLQVITTTSSVMSRARDAKKVEEQSEIKDQNFSVAVILHQLNSAARASISRAEVSYAGAKSLMHQEIPMACRQEYRQAVRMQLPWHFLTFDAFFSIRRECENISITGS